MIFLPQNFYFTAHLTLKCNFNCDYCIQKFEDPSKKIINHYDELTTEQWITGLLNFKAPFLVLSGGEVTLRNDSAIIASHVAQNFGHVEIGTNLSKDPQKLINEIVLSGHKNIVIGTSFHPNQINTKMFLLHIKKILDSPVQLNTVAIVDTFDGKGAEAHEQLLKLGIPKLSLNPYQGIYEGKIYPKEMENLSNGKNIKKVNCKTTIICISPDGIIYPCSTLCYSKSNCNFGTITNLDEERVKRGINKGIVCSTGFCQPCNYYRIFPEEI